MKVVFDFDGTICDSMPELEEIAVKLISSVYEIDEDLARFDYRETIGMSFREQLEDIFPFDHRNEEVAQTYLGHQLGIYETASVFPETFEAFELLVSENIPIAICSSSNSALTWPFIRRHFDGYNLLVTGRESGDKLFQVKRITHNDPGSWFIGDAPHDAYIASDAKVQFMGVLGTFNEFDWLNFGLPHADSVSDAVNEVLRTSKTTSES